MDAESEHFIDAISELKIAGEALYSSLIVKREKDARKFRAKMYEVIAYSLFLAAANTRRKYGETLSGDHYYDHPLTKTYTEEMREAAALLRNAARRLSNGESVERIRSGYKGRILRLYRGIGFDPKDELSRREIRKLHPERLYNIALKIMAETKGCPEKAGREVENALSQNDYMKRHQDFLERLDSLPSDEMGIAKKDNETTKKLLEDGSLIERVLRELLEK